MTVELTFVPEVESDLVEAYNWYEEQRNGLGEEFLDCVEAGLQKIRRNPKSYSEVYKQYRRNIVRRFPYMIFYEYNEDTATVYGIFHSARNPEKWRKRLS